MNPWAWAHPWRRDVPEQPEELPPDPEHERWLKLRRLFSVIELKGGNHFSEGEAAALASAWADPIDVVWQHTEHGMDRQNILRIYT